MTVGLRVPGGPGGVVRDRSRYQGRGVREERGVVGRDVPASITVGGRDGRLVRNPGVDRVGLWGWERKPGCVV